MIWEILDAMEKQFIEADRERERLLELYRFAYKDDKEGGEEDDNS